MKKLIFMILFMNAWFIKAQSVPTEPSSGFSFPLGSKFTIKLFPVDSVNYNYSVIAYEQFKEIVDTYENDGLFTTEGRDSTITFYFCLGTNGDNEKEKKENMKVLLLFKNYAKKHLEYTSEIMVAEDGKFEPTSNMGAFPSAKGTEIWPYMIHYIGLRNFKDAE